MTNLLLTMLDKAGVPHVEKLGDSSGRVEFVSSAAKAADAQAPRKTL